MYIHRITYFTSSSFCCLLFHNCTNNPDLRAKTQLISDAYEASKNIVYDEAVFQGLKGDAIKAKLDALRINEINLILK